MVKRINDSDSSENEGEGLEDDEVIKKNEKLSRIETYKHLN